LNDLDEIGDGSHLLYFNMIGYFSFRELTVESTIFVWMDFIQNKLGLKVDWVTIHPDKMEEWSKFYDKYNVE
jgi:alanyl-tRNA synthetase